MITGSGDALDAHLQTLEIGDVVRCNGGSGLGLPYLARIEGIDINRIRVRPLTHAMTAGSARSAGHRKGPSVRARWITSAYTSKVEEPHE